MSTLISTPKTAPQSSLQDQLLELIFSVAKTHVIYCAATLGIADLIDSTAKSVEDLAQATDTHTPSLYRIMRTLAGMGIFTETTPGSFAHTPLSESLRKDSPGSLHGMALMMGTEWHSRSWENLMYSVRTGKTAFDYTYGEPFFDYMQKNQDAGKIFYGAMTSISHYQAEMISSTYDFSSFHTVADIGAGHGFLLLSVLQKYPQLQGILYDLPPVAEIASSGIEAQGLSDRCQAIGGDFLESVPAGADLYMMKYIIHDWDNERAARILQNCRQMMPENGKLLIIDVVLPQGNTPHPGKYVDIEMLVMTEGGRERTETEFYDLLEQTGFRLNRVIPTDTYISLIEGVPV
ncbi:MAG: methyltransferase [bacterium]|jgi:hypothetical protein